MPGHHPSLQACLRRPDLMRANAVRTSPRRGRYGCEVGFGPVARSVWPVLFDTSAVQAAAREPGKMDGVSMGAALPSSACCHCCSPEAS